MTRPLIGSVLVLVAASLWVACATGAVDRSRPVRETQDDGRDQVTVASWDGGVLSMAQIEDRLASELRRMDIEHRLERYELLHRTLDGVVEETLLAQEVERRGLSGVDELMRIEVDERTPEPTEEALRAEFERFVRQVPRATYDEARPYLRKELRAQLREARREAFLAEVRDDSDLELTFPYPDIPRIDVPIREHDPSLGPDDAAVTIVEFAEYQCFYCRRVRPTLEKLVERYEGQVRVVYKDFPLAGHERARPAAIAAQCAGQQGAYWEMNALLMDRPDQLEDSHLRGYITSLGLDVAAWDQCFEDGVWQRRIDDDLRDGHAAGVSSTPTFFVNGRMVLGAQSYDRFAALVEEELRP